MNNSALDSTVFFKVNHVNCMYFLSIYQYLLVLVACRYVDVFVHSGEVKLTVDPEAHYRQFDRYMNKCEVLEDHELVSMQTPLLYTDMILDTNKI